MEKILCTTIQKSEDELLLRAEITKHKGIFRSSKKEKEINFPCVKSHISIQNQINKHKSQKFNFIGALNVGFMTNSFEDELLSEIILLQVTKNN